MAFASLFQTEEEKAAPKPRARRSSGSRSAKKNEPERGCEVCPLNKVKGLTKIKGAVHGRDLFVWAQSPGPTEQEEGRELLGPAGRLWWAELRKVGIKRSDVDVQNTVRCMPADLKETSYDSWLKMRDPTQEEVRCCSIYTEQAIAQSKAKIYMVLGQVAAKALFGRQLPKTKIFWSDQLKAKVYLLDHPAYLLRRGCSAETPDGRDDRLDAFRTILQQIAQEWKNDSGTSVSSAELSDQFAYIRKQDYRLVLNERQALKAEKIIGKYIAAGRRVSVDVEDYPGDDGQRVMSVCGFSVKPGQSFVFIFEHADQDPADGEKVKAIAGRILFQPEIRITMHFGCTDSAKLEALYGKKLLGFNGGQGHDSYLSEWLVYPDKKAYGLEEVAASRFPEFTGYKQVTIKETIEGSTNVPEAILAKGIDAQEKYVRDNKLFDIRKLSLETLRLYNGADADLAKRVELSNKKKNPQALMHLYIHLNDLLYRMEPNGPLFDYEQHAKIAQLYPKREAKALAALRGVLGQYPKHNKKTGEFEKMLDYNPGSPDHVKWAIYEKLGLEHPFGARKLDTRKLTLQALAQHNPTVNLQIEWRTASKAKGTYVEGYKACADINGGRLKTKWKATGTRTGRLSSSGEQGKAHNGVNLQNIHGDPHIQNMLVADVRWRKAYRAIERIVARYGEEKAPRVIERWLKKKMPDLKTFLISDYGQVEVRVAAQLSGDENLIEDCKQSDIHTAVGVTMTGWAPDKIRNDKATRTSTKNVHFGTLFGSGDEGTHNYVVARTPPGVEPMSLDEVRRARARYFARYGKVAVFIDNQRDFGREHHYVETLFGMKQPLNVTEDRPEEDVDADDDGGEEKRGSYWGNQAINGPVQGTAHQLLICGLVNLLRKAEKYKEIAIPCMDVHDALYFVVNVLDLKTAYKKTRYLMEVESLKTVKSDFPHIDWKVPIVTECEAGLRLGCKVDLSDDLTPGTFMLSWFKKCKKQLEDLDKELLAA